MEINKREELRRCVFISCQFRRDSFFLEKLEESRENKCECSYSIKWSRFCCFIVCCLTYALYIDSDRNVPGGVGPIFSGSLFGETSCGSPTRFCGCVGG